MSGVKTINLKSNFSFQSAPQDKEHGHSGRGLNITVFSEDRQEALRIVSSLCEAATKGCFETTKAVAMEAIAAANNNQRALHCQIKFN